MNIDNSQVPLQQPVQTVCTTWNQSANGCGFAGCFCKQGHGTNSKHTSTSSPCVAGNQNATEVVQARVALPSLRIQTVLLITAAWSNSLRQI